MRKRKAVLEGHRETLEESGEAQLSLTDPDARAMPSSTKVGVGYNAQIAVDAKHKLIAEQQVHNKVADLGLLAETAVAARENLARISHEYEVHRGSERDKVLLHQRLDQLQRRSPMPAECTPTPMQFARLDGRAVMADFGGGVNMHRRGGAKMYHGLRRQLVPVVHGRAPRAGRRAHRAAAAARAWVGPVGPRGQAEERDYSEGVLRPDRLCLSR